MPVELLTSVASLFPCLRLSLHRREPWMWSLPSLSLSPACTSNIPQSSVKDRELVGCLPLPPTPMRFLYLKTFEFLSKSVESPEKRTSCLCEISLDVLGDLLQVTPNLVFAAGSTCEQGFSSMLPLHVRSMRIKVGEQPSSSHAGQ